MIDVMHVVHALNGRAIAQVAGCLGEQMQELGLEVVLVASNVSDPGDGRLPVVDLGGSGRRTLEALPRLAREVRRLRPANVFAHAEGPIRSTVAVTRALRGRPHVTGVVHNHYSSYPWSTPRVRRVADAVTFSRLDALIGVSPGVTEDLVERFPRSGTRTHMVPAPLARWSAMEGLAAEPLEDPWFAAEGPRLVAVGHVHARKDHGTLIRAMAYLRDRDVALPRLAIVGDDGTTHAEQVRALISSLRLDEHVALRGVRRNPLPYVAAADALVLSSRNEGMGIVLLEAMALGTPVVSTDAPAGPRWILQDGAAGLLAPVGDHEALGDAILRLMEDHELRSRLRAAGLARAREFTPTEVCRRFLEVAGVGR